MPFIHTSEPTAVFRGKDSWYFGSGPTPGDGTVSMALWFIKNVWNKKDPPQIGLVNSDVAPGHASALYAREIFKELGLPVAADLLIPPFPMDTSSFSMQMRKAKIDLAVGIQTNAGWTVTLRDMEKFSVSVPALVVGILSDVEVKALGTVAVGMYRFSQTALWDDTDVQAVQLVRKLRNKWGYTEPADSNYFWGWMQGGIICEAISRAVKKAGGYEKFMVDINKARKLVRDVVENDMKGVDFMGLIPPLDYKPDDHRGYEQARMYQVQPDLTLKFLGLASPYPMADKYKNTKWWLEAYQKAEKK
jgi:ABC-type branched-subunit amino acid transport system substrate-binding protein